MRKLIMSMACLLLSSNAFAFKDATTLAATRELITQVRQQSTVQEKAATLERFKDFLFNRLNSIDLPDLETTPDSDPRLEEYRSLTEFDTYVNMISLRKINEKSCAAAAAHIQAATGAEQSGLAGQAPSEALLAQEIVDALCH